MGWSRKKVYNSLMQKWLDDNDILIYSTHNEVKSVENWRVKSTSKSILSWLFE